MNKLVGKIGVNFPAKVNAQPPLFVEQTGGTYTFHIDISDLVELGGFGVAGPDGVSTDNAIVRWDGIKGGTLQDSGIIIDDNNRMIIDHWTPAYDVGSNVAAQVWQQPAGFSVGDGKFASLHLIALPGATNVPMTIGAANAYVAGSSIFMEATETCHPSSTLWGHDVELGNKGPGAVRALHGSVSAFPGSTGICAPLGSVVIPATTTHTNSSAAVFSVEGGNSDVASYIKIGSASSTRARYGLWSSGGVNFKNAYLQLWMGAGCDPSARIISALNPAGTEIAGISLEGIVFGSAVSLNNVTSASRLLIDTAPVPGTAHMTLPMGDVNFGATGGASMVLMQEAPGAPFTVRKLVTGDIPVGGGGGLTAEEVDDRVAQLLKGGTNVTLGYDDAANTLTINSSLTGGGGGNVQAATAFGVDNHIIRSDSVGFGVQVSDVVIDDGGNVLVGYPTLIDQSAKLQIVANNSIEFHRASYAFANNNSGVTEKFAKAWGALGSPAIVHDGDVIYASQFYGWNGSSFSIGAVMQAVVDGTPSAGGVPMGFLFHTRGPTDPTFTPSLQINSNGRVVISNNLVKADTLLTVSGNNVGSPGGIFDLVPNSVVHIIGQDGASSYFLADSFGAVVTGFAGRFARGTAAAPLAVQTDDILVAFGAWAWDSVGWSRCGSLQYQAAEPWTSAAHGTRAQIRTIPNGGTIGVEVATFASNKVSIKAPLDVFGSTNIVVNPIFNGFGLSVGTVQVQANPSIDMNDAGIVLQAQITANSTINEFLFRGMRQFVSNGLTGGGIVQEARCHEIDYVTASGTNTSNVSGVWINMSGPGTVGASFGLAIQALSGAQQFGIYDNVLASQWVHKGTAVASSPTTGAIVVSGGIGVGGDVRVAGSVFAANVVAANLVTQGATNTIVINARDAGAQAFLANTGGALRFSFGGVEPLQIASSNVVAMPGNIASGSTTTGTLVVTGGVGVSGAINAAAVSTTGAIAAAGSITSRAGVPTGTGNAAGAALLFGSAGIGIYFGNGAPSFSAPRGSLYICVDSAGVNQRMYFNFSTTVGTSWLAFTSG